MRRQGLRIWMLGRFAVERHGERVMAWRRHTAATLLKLLLLAEGHRLSREKLARYLCPHGRPALACQTLTAAVHTLRRVLEPDLAPGGHSRYLLHEGEHLVLSLGPDDVVDLFAFERILDEVGAQADPLPGLEAAAALYGGDLLPEETAEWCLAPREALRLRWHGLLLRLAEAQLLHGRHDTAVATLSRLLAVDPTQEEAARRLMALLGRQGRRAEALQLYARLKQALRQEVHARPGQETETLAAALRAGEALPRARAALPRPDPELRQAAGNRSKGVAPVVARAPRSSDPRERPEGADRTPHPGGASRPAVPLVGRAGELARLRAALLAAHEGQGRTLLLLGEAGIGKSGLAEEAAAVATLLGFNVLAGRAGEGEQDLPYAPFVEALRSYTRSLPPRALRQELAGAEAVVALLPELNSGLLGLTCPPPLANPGAERLRLGTAVHTVLARAGERRPLLLLLEDVHWADEASLGLLSFLVRRSRDLRLLLLCTMRTDVPESHPLRTMILEGRRAGSLETVEVDGLSPVEVGLLAERYLGAPLPAAQVAALHGQCNGNPFFICELLALLDARGHEGGPGGGVAAGRAMDPEMRGLLAKGGVLPSTVRQMLTRRLDRLTIACRVLLRAGAVIGDRFDSDLLARVTGQEPFACEELLDEAIAAGLLREAPGPTGGYVLVHDLLRRALYEELLPGQRQRVQARLAAAAAGT